MSLDAEAADALVEHYGRRLHGRRRLQLDDDRDIVTLDVLALTRAPSDAEWTVRQAHPGPRDDNDEQETRRNGIERLRAERPGSEVDAEAEREDEPAAPREH